MKWGSVDFNRKSPSTHKEVFETACVLLEEIMQKGASYRDKSNESVLIFLPGLGEIEYMFSEMSMFFGRNIENF
jgi:HrpA-like RNA helicase